MNIHNDTEKHKKYILRTKKGKNEPQKHLQTLGQNHYFPIGKEGVQQSGHSPNGIGRFDEVAG